MNLVNKNLSLYFCAALFCHVVLLSAVYNWSGKNSAGTQQATSINAVILSMPSIMTAPKITHTNFENRILMQQARRISSSKLPISKNPLENEHLNYARYAQDEDTKKQHGYSKLLALLHTNIQEHQTYPLQAIMSQQSGTAIVNFTLLPNGNIVHSILHQSSGYTELDQAALDAVQAISPFKAIAVSAQQNFDVAVSFALH